MKAQGVLFPSVFDGPSLSFTAMALGGDYNNPLKRVLGVNTDVQLKDKFERDYGMVKSELDSGSYSTLLLSDEHMSVHLRNLDVISKYKELISGLGPVSKIIVYLRREDEMTLAMLSEGLKNRATANFNYENPLGIPAHIPPRLEYVRMLKLWRIANPESEFIVRPYFKNAFLKKRLLADFCSSTGLPSLEDFDSSIENRSISPKLFPALSKKAELLTSLSEPELDLQWRSFLKDLSIKYSSSASDVSGDYRSEFLSMFENQEEYLRSMYRFPLEMFDMSAKTSNESLGSDKVSSGIDKEGKWLLDELRKYPALERMLAIQNEGVVEKIDENNEIETFQEFMRKGILMRPEEISDRILDVLRNDSHTLNNKISYLHGYFTQSIGELHPEIVDWVSKLENRICLPAHCFLFAKIIAKLKGESASSISFFEEKMYSNLKNESWVLWYSELLMLFDNKEKARRVLIKESRNWQSSLLYLKLSELEVTFGNMTRASEALIKAVELGLSSTQMLVQALLIFNKIKKGGLQMKGILERFFKKKLVSETCEVESVKFTCCVCGCDGLIPVDNKNRESKLCHNCGASSRAQGLMYLFLRAVGSEANCIEAMEENRNLKIVGLSDGITYAKRLEDKFNYVNTYYHKEPFLDIANPTNEHHGRYDFLINTEVFEHVLPPVRSAFEGANRILKIGGQMIFSVPFVNVGDYLEHFPEMTSYEVIQDGDKHGILYKTPEGKECKSFDVKFHGGPGATLEMRLFNREELLNQLELAGFQCSVLDENIPERGIAWGPASRVIVARKISEI